jgi:hypothetical protein
LDSFTGPRGTNSVRGSALAGLARKIIRMAAAAKPATREIEKFFGRTEEQSMANLREKIRVFLLDFRCLFPNSMAESGVF